MKRRNPPGSRPCIVYYRKPIYNKSNDADINEELLQADFLFNSKVYKVFGNSYNDHVFAITNEGLIDVITEEYVCQLSQGLASFSCGISHFNGSTDNGEVYSWGAGKFGELGLGPCKINCEFPIKVNLSAKVISITSGKNHSLAIDDHGNMFAWGQNFERQLGLYNKPQSQLQSRGHCVIEDMLYTPRLLPICVNQPIMKVACGPNFSICITESGKIYSWGAGECGQLGTGRCTYKEVPSLVCLDDNKDTIAVDIACGFGHALAMTSDGRVYGWGLNKHGQLGLGDTDTRYKPFAQSSSYDIPKARSLCADGNSSALVDESGRLFTWGSTASDRLLHSRKELNNRTFLSTPMLVKCLLGNNIYEIAMAKKCSAVLVHAELVDINPTIGPQKSLNKLTITGCGFFTSSELIVKFTSKSSEASHSAPRSCVGELLSPTSIICKPPKLPLAGEYDVNVSLDGKEFIPDSMRLIIYKDFTISDQYPKLISKNELPDGVLDLSITIKNYDLSDQIKQLLNITVKLTITIHNQMNTKNIELYLPATINTVITRRIGLDNPSSPISYRPSSPMSRQTIINDNVINQIVNCTLDLNAIYLNEDIDNKDSIIYIQSQISLNSLDYCTISSKNCITIIHHFNPINIIPNVCSIDSSIDVMETNVDGNSSKSDELSDSFINIIGNSFIPNHVLPKGLSIYTMLTIKNNETILLPIQCNQTDLITLSKNDFIKACNSLLESNNKIANDDDDDGSYPDNQVDNTIDERDNEQTPITYPIDVKLSFVATMKQKSNYQSTTSNRFNLTPTVLSICIYQSFPLNISSSIWKIGSDEIITLTSKNPNDLSFVSTNCRICLKLKASIDNNDIVYYFDRSAISYNPIDTENGSQRYSIAFNITDIKSATSTSDDQITELISIDQVNEPIPDDNESNQIVGISNELPSNITNAPISLKPGQNFWLDCQLDGLTPSNISYQQQIVFYDKLTVLPSSNILQSPKGQTNKIQIAVDGLPKTIPLSFDGCIVRLRGIGDGYINIRGDISIDIKDDNTDISTGYITILSPDSTQLSTIKPEGKGKDKKYYVDISLNYGQSFDCSDSPTLPIK